MKKLILLIMAGFMCFTSVSQEPNPDVIKEWYLHAITISGISHSPADYGFYPTIQFTSSGAFYTFYIADPLNISCSCDDVQFTPNPDVFHFVGDWICLPEQTCMDGPQGPCSLIYGMHADFYYDTLTSPFNYTLTYNTDETQTLEVINENGDISVYGSEPLLDVPSFSKTQFRIYPNPVSETLFIASEDYGAIKKISIFSTNGKRMVSEKENTHKLNVSALPTGLYFIEIASKTGVSVQKFVKK